MKVFIDGIAGYYGWNVAAQIDKRHELCGSVYPPKGCHENETPRRPSVHADQLVESVKEEKAERLLAEADVIIVPALDSLSSAMDILKHVTQLQYEGTKTFVCVSSVMTWARTKKTGMPLEENAFRARRSPVKFQDLKNFENIVLSCNSAKLRTVVVGAGVAYGNGEGILETFFRDAWLFPKEMLGVPVLGDSEGKNSVPMVHIVDLARLVAAFIEPAYDLSSRKGLYVLSVDDSRNSLVDIIAAISSTLASGKIRHLVDFEIQDLMIENPQATSSLQANLAFNAGSTYASGLSLEWHCKSGLVPNIRAVAQEFIEYRQLIAPRVSVLGPPGIDAGALGEHLSEYYQVPLVTQRGVEAELVELGEAGSEAPVVLALLEYQAAAAKSKKAPKAMTPEQVVDMFRWKLAQSDCRNRGWVMVGFPNTAEEAELLCTDGKQDVVGGGGGGGDDGDGDDEDVQVTYNVNPLNAPRKLVVVDASDGDLEQRVTSLSDEELASRHGDVQSFQKALALYRSTHGGGGDDGGGGGGGGADGVGGSSETEAQYFLQTHCDIDALYLRTQEADVGGGGGGGNDTEGGDGGRPEPESVTSERVVDTCRLYIENGQGKPFNYRPTRAERLELARAAEEEAAARREAEVLHADEARRAETAAREQEELELEQRRNKFIRQEMQMLERRAMPLREYLMDSVVPVLTEGLLEVCKTKPEDPVDYLAEWLFRYIPEAEAGQEAATAAATTTTSPPASAVESKVTGGGAVEEVQ